MRGFQALKPGDTIGLVSPGSMADPAAIAAGRQILASLGFEAVEGAHLDRKLGYMAGTEDERLADLHAMYADPAVRAILCVRGGDGSTRLLDLLDYELIAANPKPLIGYSDITVLHASILKRTDLVGLHGPMLAADFPSTNQASLDHLVAAVTSTEPLGELHNPSGTPLAGLVAGRASGRLVGGNVSLIQTLIGTPYMYELAGAILFIEDVEEPIYRIDRVLTQLTHAGLLQQVAGVVIGDFLDYRGTKPDTLSLEQVWEHHLVRLGVPVLSGLECGHDLNKLTLPIGAEVTLDASAPSLTVTEAIAH